METRWSLGRPKRVEDAFTAALSFETEMSLEATVPQTLRQRGHSLTLLESMVLGVEYRIVFSPSEAEEDLPELKFKTVLILVRKSRGLSNY